MRLSDFSPPFQFTIPQLLDNFDSVYMPRTPESVDSPEWEDFYRARYCYELELMADARPSFDESDGPPVEALELSCCPF